MRNLFFVSVAVGILSGTSISVKGQASVNMEKFGSIAQPRFLEGIEIKQVATDVVKPFKQLIKTTATASTAKKAAGTTEFAGTIEQCNSLQFKFAQLMSTEVESISNFTLFSFINDWWAVRYRYGGTTKKGVDCSSYTGQLVQATYGVTLPRTARAQYGVTQRVSREDLQEGDLVFFNTRGGVSHVGVYVGNNHFTHSSCHDGVTISSLEDPYYSRKFISGGRLVAAEPAASLVGEDCVD